MTNRSAEQRAWLRGLLAGVAVGIILLAAAGSWAAMGKSHWEQRNWHFQAGYLAGFLDAVRAFQQRHPQTAMAMEYKVPPRVGLNRWLELVNELYQDEAHAGRPLSQIIIIAGDQIAAEVGYVRSPSGAAGFEALQRFMVNRNRRMVEEKRKGEGDAGSGSDAPAVDEGPSEPDE